MYIFISHTNPDPLYKQITDQIKNAIASGQLKEGEALPSIRGLAKELKTSVITIKRAYSDLENEGYIITRPGLGSFVASISKERLKDEKLKEIEAKLKSITEDAKKYGIKIDDIINILKELEGWYLWKIF